MIQSSTADNAAKEAWSPEPVQKDPIENQGYAIMCSPIQNPQLLPIIPKLLSFRLAILGQYLPFHAWFLAKGAQRNGFLHGRATTHWLKIITHRLQRGHLPTTRCPPSFSRQFCSSTIPCLSLLFFFLSRRHFVFLFISPWSPRKLNKPRPPSLRPRKLGRRIKSYSPPSSPPT